MRMHAYACAHAYVRWEPALRFYVYFIRRGLMKTATDWKRWISMLAVVVCCEFFKPSHEVKNCWHGTFVFRFAHARIRGWLHGEFSARAKFQPGCWRTEKSRIILITKAHILIHILCFSFKLFCSFPCVNSQDEISARTEISPCKHIIWLR